MKRRRAEAALAVLFAGAVVRAGGAAMLKPGPLKAETIALLQTPLRLESGASTGYALGWKVESVQLAGAPARMLTHRGSPMGGSISLLMFPDLGLVIAAASNVSHAKGVAPLGLKVAEAFTRPASRSPNFENRP